MDDFPYKFQNQNDKIITNQFQDEAFKSAFTNLIHDPRYDLTNGFKFAYTSVVKAIAERDLHFIEQMTEKHLADRLVDSISEVNENGYQLSCLNDETEDIEMELLQMRYVVGAYIDRDKNQESR